MNKTIVSGLLAIGCIAQAQATSLTGAEVLQQFNVVVLNNDTSYSHVDGRTYVGGNLTGGDYVQHPNDTPASAYTGLTVRGDVSNVHVNGLGASVGGNLTNSTINSGAATVGGNATWVNFNGGKAAVGGTVTGVNFNGGTYADPAGAIAAATAQANSTDFASVTTATSQQLMGLADTGSSVTINGNRVTFNAVAIDGVAVFDLTAIDDVIFGLGEFEFNRNGATSMIFNTDVTNATIAANFLGGSAQGIAIYSVWNFWNTENLTINNQFGGSILAPWATFTNYNDIEGAVIVESLNQYGEIHERPYGGDVPTPVPLPGALGLMLSGLGVLAGVRARKG